MFPVHPFGTENRLSAIYSCHCSSAWFNLKDLLKLFNRQTIQKIRLNGERVKTNPGDSNIRALALDLLSDQRSMMHRSHEAFLEYVYQSMKVEKEALFLKLALCRGIQVEQRVSSIRLSKWDSPVASQIEFNKDKPAQFSLEQINEFATGSLSKCFGDHYSIYEGRRAPRTPNGDLLLMSRILEVNGTRGKFNQPANLISEFDVRKDAWFFRKNSAPVMPYSIFMEIALQPCGFLATYMGCTLIYPNLELCFRNLDSNAEMLQEIDLRNRTVTTRSTLTSVAASAETVIVQFDYELLLEGQVFFRGNTAFGYFTPNALANQVGLDRGEKIPPWFRKQNLQPDQGLFINLNSKESKQNYFRPPADKPYFFQPAGQLNFLDSLLVFENEGNYGLGYVYGEKEVDPDDWFFPCHFFQDPVMPGSLGVEAILQSMRIFAIRKNLGTRFISPYFTNAVGKVIWKYRGQIIQSNKIMSVEAHIKQVEAHGDRTVVKADASLWKDGLRIYELTDASISIVEGAL